MGYQDLAFVASLQGSLVDMENYANKATSFAVNHASSQFMSLSWEAWANHLLGNVTQASEMFHTAESIQHEHERRSRFLYGLRGIQFAKHLQQLGQLEKAKLVTENNLDICKSQNWSQYESLNNCILGDLAATNGQHDVAVKEYEKSISTARNFNRIDALIEALLARGRWAARLASPDPKGFENPSGLTTQAFSDLNEALGYATTGGYRLYEADIRIALAWAHLAAGTPAPARREATRARTMSHEMGYHWGVVDAEEVLGVIE